MPTVVLQSWIGADTNYLRILSLRVAVAANSSLLDGGAMEGPPL